MKKTYSDSGPHQIATQSCRVRRRTLTVTLTLWKPYRNEIWIITKPIKFFRGLCAIVEFCKNRLSSFLCRILPRHKENKVKNLTVSTEAKMLRICCFAGADGEW